MEFSPFSIITCLILICNVINSSSIKSLYIKNYTLSLIYSIIFDIGYFCEIGSTCIEYNYVFSVINILTAIPIMFNTKFDKKAVIAFIVLIVSILFGIIFTLVFNVNYQSVSFAEVWDIYFDSDLTLPYVSVTTHSFFLFVRLIIFVFTFYVFVSIFDVKGFYGLIRLINKIAYWIIGISVVEFLLTNFVDATLFREICFQIFGRSDSTFPTSRINFGFYFPLVFMREPSNYAYMLFMLELANIASMLIKRNTYKKYSSNLLYTAYSVIMLIFTGSLSAYVYLAVIFLIYLLINKNKKNIIFFLCIAILAVVIFTISAWDRFLKVFELFANLELLPADLSSNSEIIRIYSIVNNLKFFAKSPLWGCGLGTIYCYSSVVTMLSNIGLIGCISFVVLISNITKRFYGSKKLSLFSLLIIVIAHLFTGHMGYLLYLDRAAYLYLIIVFIDLFRAGSKNYVRLKSREIVGK